MSRFARVETLCVATAGTTIFWWLNFPLPFLFGPMAFCLVAALAQRSLAGFGQISVAARTILGVAVGASITPDVISRLPEMAGSVLLIPVYIVTIAAIGIPFFNRVCGFDTVTSYYAAMPGGLQDMVIFGTEAGGDARALSLIHATRVLIIVSIAPVILTLGFDVSLDAPLGEPASSLPLHELLLMVFAALAGWKFAERLGLYGAAILGPMILTAILSLTDVIHYRPPEEAILASQFMIGIGLGVGYVGVTLAELRRDVLAGVAFVLILAMLALVFTEIVVLSGLAEPLEGFLSFAPGGQAEMTLLAVIVGADLGFIIVHHLTRMFLVITCAPIAIQLMKKH